MPLLKSVFRRKLTVNQAFTKATDIGQKSLLNYWDLANTNATPGVDDDGDNDHDILYGIDVWDACSSKGCLVKGKDAYVDSQVRSLRLCVGADGKEDPIATMLGCKSNIDWTLYDLDAVQHLSQSSNSVLVFGLGKRMTGDSMTIEPPPTRDQAIQALLAMVTNANASAVSMADEVVNLQLAKMRTASLKNPRKVYSLTLGRLMWETEDLSAAYHATCTAPNKSCQGLRLELGNQSRHLVVGSDFLPLNALTDFSGSSYLWTPLVRMLTTGTVYDGDVAFPLAFNQQTWPRLNGSDCKASKDQKLSSIVANHYYADHALQPTYTAALMWLFKYGTMREVISVNGSSTPSLAFAQNIQIKAVLACTPLNSVLFTAAGCAVVILASLYISCKSIGGAKSESVVSIQGIAQLVVDEEKVPNAFVKCSLPSGTQTKDADTATSIRNYELGGVTLRHKTDARLGRQIEDEDKASV